MSAQEMYCDELECDLRKARRIIEAVETLYFNASENGTTARVDLAHFNVIAGMIADFNRETEDRKAGAA